jgi:hypothetical protein
MQIGTNRKLMTKVRKFQENSEILKEQFEEVKLSAIGKKGSKDSSARNL